VLCASTRDLWRAAFAQALLVAMYWLATSVCPYSYIRLFNRILEKRCLCQACDYVFRLYALSISHVSGQALTFSALLAAIDHAVIGTTSIIGTFKLPN
jgi:hypothetical protein